MITSPRFPRYAGEIPEVLDPLNPRHYLLLIYWIVLQPTALKTYLHQADPAFYRTGPELDLPHFARVKAYRRLYLMLPILAIGSSVIISLPAAIWYGFSPDLRIDLGRYSAGILAGTLLTALIGMGFSGAYDMATGIVSYVTFGVGSGVTLGLAAGVMSVSGDFSDTRFLWSMAFSLIWGFAIAQTMGTALQIVGGVGTSILVGLVGGSALALTSLAGSTGATQIQLGLMGIVLIGGMFAIGALRLPLLPVHVATAMLSLVRLRWHPLTWDEMLVIPQPGSTRVVLLRLREDEAQGLQLAARVLRNPFQHWAAQSALQAHLHEQPAPLGLLYRLLSHPRLDAYFLPPPDAQDWEIFPTVRRAILGELARRPVTYGDDWTAWLPEKFMWALTGALLDDHRVTPLTRFAGMLYDLLDPDAVDDDAFDLTRYRTVYRGLGDDPGGREIAATFDAMAAFLACDDVLDLPRATARTRAIDVAGPPFRPGVMMALRELRHTSAEIAAYQDATSRVNRQAALLRATDALDALDDEIAEVVAPERFVLRRIIRQWRQLVSEAGGEVGRAQDAGPVPNPYVAGNPVVGDLFVGREDVLRRLEELWGHPGQVPSVVLYGHRRMGKSSILHNLGARFGADTSVVDFNMQRVGLVESTGELLYNMGLALYDSLPQAHGRLPEPEAPPFLENNPYTAFDRYLKQVNPVRHNRRFIITVDEFELIERGVAEGQLEARLLDFWRGVIHTYPWFVMAFAGLHTLEEMRRDYWHPLFGSVTAVHVGFLSPAAARRLITQPSPDFPLDYEQDAIDHIIHLTHGQPYLVQLIGHELVARFNRETFEHTVIPDAAPRPRRFSVGDVQAVVRSPNFYRDGDAYFTGVWRQAETTPMAAPTPDRGMPAQNAVLQTLAPAASGLPFPDLVAQVRYPESIVQAALETLERHDVVVQWEGHWAFTVELMRRWVATRHPGPSGGN